MGIIPTKDADLEDALQLGLDWSLREGHTFQMSLRPNPAEIPSTVVADNII